MTILKSWNFFYENLQRRPKTRVSSKQNLSQNFLRIFLWHKMRHFIMSLETLFTTIPEDCIEGRMNDD